MRWSMKLSQPQQAVFPKRKLCRSQWSFLRSNSWERGWHARWCATTSSLGPVLRVTSSRFGATVLYGGFLRSTGSVYEFSMSLDGTLEQRCTDLLHDTSNSTNKEGKSDIVLSNSSKNE